MCCTLCTRIVFSTEHFCKHTQHAEYLLPKPQYKAPQVRHTENEKSKNYTEYDHYGDTREHKMIRSSPGSERSHDEGR